MPTCDAVFSGEPQLTLWGTGIQHFEYIKKEWIVSPTARRVYRAAASVSLMLFFCLLLVLFTGGVPRSVAPLARALLFVGTRGAGTTFVGMETFLFRFDDSPALKQVFWFCLMLLPMLGPALYCFLVYSRSNALRLSCAEAPPATNV